MHFQFLIEDQSGTILVDQVMQKLLVDHPDVTCDYKSFGGIGGFQKKWSPNQAKKQKLLNDLPVYLRGFDRSLNTPGYEAALIIVVDNDDRDTEEFRQKLEHVAESVMITMDHIFCIAVEEMEAWLLGDRAALLQAYPVARISILNEYKQDSICGTWEKLAAAVWPGGLAKFKSSHKTGREIGTEKCEWARRVGGYMGAAKRFVQNPGNTAICYYRYSSEAQEVEMIHPAYLILWKTDRLSRDRIDTVLARKSYGSAALRLSMLQKPSPRTTTLHRSCWKASTRA